MARKHKRHPGTPETTLYAPVKRYLEALGFTVKGEVCGCDLVFRSHQRIPKSG